MQWVKPKGKSSLPDTPWQPKDLLPRLKKLPSKRLLHVPNVTTDSLDFRLFFDPAGSCLLASPRATLAPGQSQVSLLLALGAHGIVYTNALILRASCPLLKDNLGLASEVRHSDCQASMCAMHMRHSSSTGTPASALSSRCC